jgi:hypothetical protein
MGMLGGSTLETTAELWVQIVSSPSFVRFVRNKEAVAAATIPAFILINNISLS